MDMSAVLTATEVSAAIHAGSATAVGMTTVAIERINRFGDDLGAVTECLADRALRRAAAVDAELAAGRDPGPLTGVPFGVKDMYDVEGVTTLAGSTILADDPPAAKDAAAIQRLEQAGAVLVSTFRMDEFAYNFTSQNAHYGLIRNPHDLDRMAGGSSSGSAAAAAAGLVPLAVGSDTNGSIRVPAALCGLFSWKPTFGTV
jgi:1-carboxybiuret hydrolase